MIGELLLSGCIPLSAWVAYGRLDFCTQPAFRWGMAHLVALAWLQLGAQILLGLHICTPISMGLWIIASLAWFRPTSPPKIPAMGLYLLLIPYFALALVPPWYRDSLTYHLTLPKLFAQTQGYTAGDEIIFGYFPLGWHSILSYLYVLSPEEGSALFNPRLVSVWISGAVAITTSGLCRMLGATQWWSLICGACFLLIPTQIEFGTSAYVQTWLTLVCVCAAGFAYRKDFVWMGICAGLAASAKYSGLFLCLLIGIIALRNKKSRRTVIPMVLVGGWFYLRNLWLKGNPLFPLAYSIFGGEGWDETRAEMYAQTLDHYGMGKDLLDNLFLWPRVFLTQDLVFFFQGSLGPAVGIIALIALWKWKQYPNVLILGCGWAILWMFQVQQIRFLMPCIPIFLAVGLSISTNTRRDYRTGSILIASMLVWLLVPFQPLNRVLQPQVTPLYDAPLTFLWKRQHTSKHLNTPFTQQEIYTLMHGDLGTILNSLSQEENIQKVWLVWCRGFTYSIKQSFRVDGVFEGFRWEKLLSEEKTIQEWKHDLKREGISHLLINHQLFLMDAESPIEKQQQSTFQMLLDERVLTPAIQSGRLVLYVVDWESDSDSESGGFKSPQ